MTLVEQMVSEKPRALQSMKAPVKLELLESSLIISAPQRMRERKKRDYSLADVQ